MKTISWRFNAALSVSKIGPNQATNEAPAYIPRAPSFCALLMCFDNIATEHNGPPEAAHAKIIRYGASMRSCLPCHGPHQATYKNVTCILREQSVGEVPM